MWHFFPNIKNVTFSKFSHYATQLIEILLYGKVLEFKPTPNFFDDSAD